MYLGDKKSDFGHSTPKGWRGSRVSLVIKIRNLRCFFFLFLLKLSFLGYLGDTGGQINTGTTTFIIYARMICHGQHRVGFMYNIEGSETIKLQR